MTFVVVKASGMLMTAPQARGHDAAGCENARLDRPCRRAQHLADLQMPQGVTAATVLASYDPGNPASNRDDRQEFRQEATTERQKSLERIAKLEELVAGLTAGGKPIDPEYEKKLKKTVKEVEK